PHKVYFLEPNFHDEKGMIRLSLETDSAIRVLKSSVPNPLTWTKKFEELTATDIERLRTASATIEATGAETHETPAVPEVSAKETPTSSLGQMLVLLGVAFVLGAAHALTPGHGKTLVAAYLVGERGTFGHAVLLGVVTTLTHTGVILLVAA